jgi:hypothetical protein
LRQGADLSVLGGEVALSNVHQPRIRIGCAAQLRRFQSNCRQIPHCVTG